MLPTSHCLVYSRHWGWVEAETKDLACKKQGAGESGSDGTEWNRSPEHWEWGRGGGRWVESEGEMGEKHLCLLALTTEVSGPQTSLSVI